MCENCKVSEQTLKRGEQDRRLQPQPGVEGRAFNAESGQPNARILIRHRIESYRKTADALEALLASIPAVLPMGAESGLLELCIHPPR